MKKTLILMSILLGLMLVSPMAIAQETTEDPGITPDSVLWGLDRAIEQISLLLTASPEAKATKGLEIAHERLLEVKVMIEENKLEAALKAQENHGKNLDKVKARIKEVEEDDSEKELEELIEIEKELEEHEKDVEETSGELKIKIKVEGELTQEQRDLIDSLLESLEVERGKVEIEIENKKDKTKIKIKIETGKEGDKVEKEIKDKTGLSNFEKKHAEKMLEKANKKWKNVIRKAEKFNVSLPDKSAFDNLIAQGDIALADGRNEEAKDLYEAAKDLAEELKEEIEDANEETEKDELEIEVKIKNGMAEVGVEFAGEELEFTLETTDRELIISEIIERTGLTREEIESVMEFEEEGDNDKDGDNDNNETDAIECGLKPVEECGGSLGCPGPIFNLDKNDCDADGCRLQFTFENEPVCTDSRSGRIID